MSQNRIQAIRRYLHDSTTDPSDRARVLLDIVRTFYDQHWLMTASRLT